MNLILWIVIGGAAGWLASMITHNSNGFLMDIVLGIVGALVGGFVMNLFGQSGVNGFDVYSFVVATIGAVLIIMVGRAFTGKRTFA